MQVMYNQIMEAVNKINESKGQPESFGFITPQGQPTSSPVRIKAITRSAEQWHELKRACESVEEWNEVKRQIENAENLSPKQQQLIINTP